MVRKSLLEIIDEASYDQMFDPETLAKMKDKSKAALPQGTNMHSLMAKTMQLLSKVEEAEEGYTDELEELAIQIVKDSYPVIDYAGIKIDAQITSYVGENHFEGKPIEQVEDPEFDEVKRRIINATTQGGATRGTFNYMIFSDYINDINPELVQDYTELMKSVFNTFDDDQSVTIMLRMLAQGAKVEGGVSEVTWDEDGSNLTIHARAVCFPMLVHEIVKGLYEILSLQGFGADLERNKKVVKRVDRIENEPEDMRYGKFIYDALNQLYVDSSSNDPRLRELFFTEIYKLPDVDFKSFINNAINEKLTSGQQSWVNKIIVTIEKDLRGDDANQALS